MGDRFGLITSEHVAKAAKRMNKFSKSERGLQRAFVEGMLQQLSHIDLLLLAGEWRWVRTHPGDPFMLSDSPVITFTRSPTGTLDYGMGFHEPNVEAALPMSPTACLHVLPDMRRTRATQVPTTLEINRGEAGFASNACYCNGNFPHLDAIMQADGARWRMGENIFTLPKKNYTNIFYDILMGIRQPQNW